MLVEIGGTNLGQDGYGMAFNATESTMDEWSLTESIICYTEHVTAL